MLPTLWPNDVIAVRRVPHSDIVPGKLVVYTWEGPEKFSVHRAVRWDADAASVATGVTVSMFTVHRAIRWEHDAGALITRGDSILEYDPPVQTSRIYGEVVAVQRGGRRLAPALKLTGASKLFCYFLRRSGRLRNLLLRFHSVRQSMSGLWSARSMSAPHGWGYAGQDGHRASPSRPE